MKILSFIEDEQVIKKILTHLGLWKVKARPPPKTKAPPVDMHLDYSDSQLPPSEEYLYVDVEYPEAILA